MSFHGGIDYSAEAGVLIQTLVNEHDLDRGAGSLTCSVYDTAWVSMIAKTTNGHTRWLFPSAFQYLLNHQQHDGGWQNRNSDADGILNSLAALLSLCRHITQACQIKTSLDDLQHRKSRAIYFLETKFSSWSVDVSVTDSGTQPLMAKLLQMLQREGIQFCFPRRHPFFQGKEGEDPQCIQTSICSEQDPTVIGSLEGQIGKIDFGCVGQHKISGSMRASPASTAAYLMNCPAWDDEAEAYLTDILSLDNGRTAGGVPTKFPTSIFELTNVIATLLENGFTHKELGIRALGEAATYVDDCLRIGWGATGFAPYFESDADNTAKAISVLCLLGHPTSPQGLIVRYESCEYFKTHTQDRTPSFGTNCRVLKALLDLLPGNRGQESQIEKTVSFLCNCWWATIGRIEDHSNVSANYPIMLMVEALTQLVSSWEKGYVPTLNDSSIRNKVIISLFQALIRILRTQNADGSWEGGGCEVTSYAIISLTKLVSLSSAPRIKHQVAQAIDSGRNFLCRNFKASTEPDNVWKEKITSGIGSLYKAFALAALKLPVPLQQSRSIIESHFEIPLAKMTIQTKYYARQPWFVGIPEWLIQACWIETFLFLPLIGDVRNAIFPCVDDKHFESFPFAWLVANNLDNRYIGAEFIHQIAILTILGRQLEIYMEHVVREAFAGCTSEIENFVHSVFEELAVEDFDLGFCDSHTGGNSKSSTAPATSDFRSVLRRFLTHVLKHPCILMASSQDQAQLRSELLSFLICRIHQLSGGQDGRSSTDQTPHLYTFAFLACLVGKQHTSRGVGLGCDFLESPEQQYLAADLCRHMSIISFLSTNADEQQATCAQPALRVSNRFTLRSQHVASRSISSTSTCSSSYDEPCSPLTPISGVSSASCGSSSEISYPQSPIQQPTRPIQLPTEPSKETLQMTRLLSHERRCLNLCFQGLTEAGIDRSTADVIKLFVDFNDLSEQIYRDPNIGTTYQPAAAHGVANEACVLTPPSPVPSKRTSRSVAAARAALVVEPTVAKQPHPHDSRNPQFIEGDEWIKPLAHTDPIASAVRMERDWSWNKKSVGTTRRLSRASSEVSRIETIMSEIDGVKLQVEHRPIHQFKGRAASNCDAGEAQALPENDAQSRLISKSALDTETKKLAKARLETQRRLSREAHRTNINTNIPRNKVVAKAYLQCKLGNPLQTKAIAESNSSEIKRRATCPPESAGWVKAPPPESLKSEEARSTKLHRACRLGGPRWKAPF